MSAIIFINDNNIVIQQGGSVNRTQGYARIVDDSIYFDFNQNESAVRYCRLQPQQIHNRYWQQCAQHSINVEHKEIRNSADLIWQHLKLMREQYDLNDVVLIVPSHYQKDNLQLLLGIAESTGLKPQGLINMAVLAAQQSVHDDGYCMHIDYQLHQTVCSLVEVKKGVAKLSDVDVISQVSIQAVYDALLKDIQQQFIHGDRFDPMHYAETEQQLFDQIVPVAQLLSETGKATITVQHNMHSYSIVLDNTQWNSILQPFVDQIIASSQTNKVNTSLVQLNQMFGGIVPAPFKFQNVTVVREKALAADALIDVTSLEEGVSYKLELSLIDFKNKSKKINAPNSFKQKEAVSNEVAVDKPVNHVATNLVTHLMQSGIAVPLNRASIKFVGGQLQLLDSSVANLDSILGKKQLFILNAPDRQELQLNDRLGSNHADGVITAIQVIS